MTITPTNDNVVIKIKKADDSQQTTKSGLILPKATQEKQEQGVIVAVGPGRVLSSGALIPVSVKEGDHVLYNKYAGTEVAIEDDLFLIVKENDILAIIKE